MRTKKQDPRIVAMAILEELRKAGHVALFAGGCVRDRLLNREPKDYDIATDAKPDRVCKLFRRARRVGAKFGVILVHRRGVDIEVATFRMDGVYSDGRHPDDITYGTAEQDARRRDFTINGLFHDPIDDRIVDYVGGLADLEAGIIRTIGNPDQRFAEDHLRLLRAVRFAARLGFAVEATTREAMVRLAPRLAGVSPERIWQELEWMLLDQNRSEAWTLLAEVGLTAHIAPSWSPTNEQAASIGARLGSLQEDAVTPALVLATLLCDGGDEQATEVCRDLRTSNRIADHTAWLIRSSRRVETDRDLDLAGLKTLMAHPCWLDLLALARARANSDEGDANLLNDLVHRAAAIAPDTITPPPLLTGDDLCNLGMAPGPAMGRMLGTLYTAQLNEAITTRDGAIEMMRRLQDD